MNDTCFFPHVSSYSAVQCSTVQYSAVLVAVQAGHQGCNQLPVFWPKPQAADVATWRLERAHAHVLDQAASSLQWQGHVVPSPCE